MSGPFGSTAWMANPSSGFYDFPISNSLRFEDGDSAYLNRTPSSAGNRRTWTFSTWVKRANLGVQFTFFGARGNNANEDNSFQLVFKSSDAIAFGYGGGVWKTTTQLFRDPSAWLHVVFALDTTQGTGADRTKLYINGTQVTSFTVSNTPGHNLEGGINKAIAHRISHYAAVAPEPFDGYLAETCLIDGTALTSSSFGETKNDIWIPKDTSGLTFGTNGFRLQYKQVGTGTASTSTIGADTSGETNHWTSNSLVASDVMPDTPTNNFATLNVAMRANLTISEGNLKVVGVGNNFDNIAGTISFDPTDSRGYYFEYRSSGNDDGTLFGISDPQNVNFNQSDPTGSFTDGANGFGYKGNGGKRNNDTNENYGNSYTSGDILSCAIKSGSIFFYKNGTIQNSGTAAYTSIAGTKVVGFAINGTQSGTVNFGQDSSFAGTETAQGNADSNGIGDFYYAVPSGYVALCTSNLPAPVETVDPAQGGSPQDYFNSTLYTGTGSLLAVTTGFQPDWTWIKSRTTTDQHIVQDSVRGNFILYPDSTQAEGATGGGWVTETSTGFTADANGPINTSGETYVAWNWKAGTSFSNDASATGVGTIDSAGSVNTDVGFSIINYTGTGATSQQTISCGLSWSNKEKLVIIKNRDAATNWLVNSTILSANKVLRLNTSDNESQVNSSGYITYESFGFRTYNGGTGLLNVNNQNFICYCFHEVDGYSKFGSYTGNGSVNGPFIYTGFRPAWIMIKNTDTADDNWYMADTKRNPNNVVKQILEANNVLAEYTTGSNKIDIVSNGIKCRDVGGNMNVSGENYIYMAFAEQPFKYANAR